MANGNTIGGLEVVGHKHRIYSHVLNLILVGAASLTTIGAGVGNVFFGEGDFIPDFQDGVNTYEAVEIAGAAATVGSFIWLVTHLVMSPVPKSIGHPIVAVPASEQTLKRKVSVQ